MSQNPTVSRMNRSIKALTRMQQMMGMKDEPDIVNQQPVTDIDGNVYQTVKVGNQIWMAENLKVCRYRNGDSISNIVSPTEWLELSTGGYCNYDNNISNGDKYGRLYNFFAVLDKRNIAPKGWHVATIADWNTLTNTLAGIKIENEGVMTEILDVENKLGFALMSGIRLGDGNFGGIDKINFIWSATWHTDNKAWMWISQQGSRLMSYTSKDLMQTGCSVRCVKDAPKVNQVTKSTTKKKK